VAFVFSWGLGKRGRNQFQFLLYDGGMEASQRIAVIAVMDRDGKIADFWLGKKVDSAAASKVQSHGE